MSSSRSAGAMRSSGAMLMFPPLVRPWLMFPFVLAPPDWADSGRSVGSSSS